MPVWSFVRLYSLYSETDSHTHAKSLSKVWLGTKSAMGSPDWHVSPFWNPLLETPVDSAALEKLESREMTEQTDWWAKPPLQMVACISENHKFQGARDTTCSCGGSAWQSSLKGWEWTSQMNFGTASRQCWGNQEMGWSTSGPFQMYRYRFELNLIE